MPGQDFLFTSKDNIFVAWRKWGTRDQDAIHPQINVQYEGMAEQPNLAIVGI